jgi:hypothetical protein
MINKITLESLVIVAKAITDIGRNAVFAGGSVTPFLITDSASAKPRPTKDIDVIVGTDTRLDYYHLEEELRKRGFSQVIEEDTPLCRWKIKDILVDVMPSNVDILGFTNRWYAPALENAEILEIEDGLFINIIKAPYFLATKMEAFSGRGGNDYMSSHDMEDIITVIDGRDQIVSDISQSPDDLKSYLKEKFHEYLACEDFISCISGHLFPDQASQSRVPIVLKRITEIAG